MRPHFEKNLYTLQSIVKTEKHLQEEPTVFENELNSLGDILDNYLITAAEIRNNSREDQENIYELQKQKNQIMLDMKNNLLKLSQGNTIEWKKSAVPLIYKDTEKTFSILKTSRPITQGEILTDMTWGLYYELPKNCPQGFQKNYIVAEAKQQLRTLLDQQIIIDELGSQSTTLGIRSAYTRSIDEKNRNEISNGIITEQMVQNYLQKLTFDFDLNFRVIPSDIHLDINKKIDFIIQRKTLYRGIEVGEIEKGTIGVQFLSKNDEHLVHQKEQQLKEGRERLKTGEDLPIDDYVLVSIPLKDSREIYKHWAQKRTPGGPDKLWDKQTKELIFRKTLESILTPQEIDEQWSMINNE